MNMRSRNAPLETERNSNCPHLGLEHSGPRHSNWEHSNRRRPNWGHPDRDAGGTGFVTRLGSPASHEVIRLSLTALERLTHRGGVDADGASGDGAGLLTSMPEEFFRVRAREQGAAWLRSESHL